MDPQQKAFHQEWDGVLAAVRAELSETLTDLGMTAETLAYVLRFRGIPKLPHLSAVWVLDADLRRRLGTHAGLHCVGIKLVDDLLDADQPYPARDLGMGVYLVQKAMCQMGQYADPAAVLAAHQRDYQTFWRVQLEEVRQPPRDREEWVACARIKSGLLMASYAEMACLAGGRPEAVAPARALGEALGTLVMIADDLKDHVQLGQTAGNLGFFIRQGTVSAAAVEEMIEGLRATAREALRQGPVAHDIAFVVDDYADDTLRHHLASYR